MFRVAQWLEAAGVLKAPLRSRVTGSCERRRWVIFRGRDAQCWALPEEAGPPPAAADTADLAVLVDQMGEAGVRDLFWMPGHLLEGGRLMPLLARARQAGLVNHVLLEDLLLPGTLLRALRRARVGEVLVPWPGEELPGPKLPGEWTRQVLRMAGEGLPVTILFPLIPATAGGLADLYRALIALPVVRLLAVHPPLAGTAGPEGTGAVGTAIRETLGVLLSQTGPRPVPDLVLWGNGADVAVAAEAAPAAVARLPRWNQADGLVVEASGLVHPWDLPEVVYGSLWAVPLAELWERPEDSHAWALSQRAVLLPEPCRACAWERVCGGNSRGRALAAGRPWGMDPACYLGPEERHRAVELPPALPGPWQEIPPRVWQALRQVYPSLAEKAAEGARVVHRLRHRDEVLWGMMGSEERFVEELYRLLSGSGDEIARLLTFARRLGEDEPGAVYDLGAWALFLARGGAFLPSWLHNPITRTGLLHAPWLCWRLPEHLCGRHDDATARKRLAWLERYLSREGPAPFGELSVAMWLSALDAAAAARPLSRLEETWDAVLKVVWPFELLLPYV
ncbi:protein of unknown function [Candidatus Hydrogenisulfobacillus filiaventi]|uniref:Uncharacterized protein n=1 Tax=Candidatus Hydrogenisulfobacillus filiaventi TaxID=2707344 RepID=A0A6F8ZGF6_9FIRM|nr:hypothetical protein [Bacillota bacterium]CAB1128787.1 protein of unknown function [Candidatus Hydrogenisulfobacillus filiaventi]